MTRSAVVLLCQRLILCASLFETISAWSHSTKSPTRTRRLGTCLLGSPRDDANDPSPSPSGGKRAPPKSAWEGAGVPREDLPPGEIPTLLMKGLSLNDFPEIDSGLESMWAFAAGGTKHIFQHNVTEFVESAHETADTLPTSFYGVAMNGQSWEMETDVNMVGGEDGWIATQVMKTISSDGRLRRWQWELRKNRRPPCLGCWMVESIGSSDRRGKFEPE